MIKINDITINVYNSGPNPAWYTINAPYLNASLNIHQSDMELIVANLQVLVEQNKRKKG